MEAPEEVEVEPDGVEEVGADPVSSLVAAGRGSIPSISASQSFSAKMSVAASSQFRKSEWELRGLMTPMEARAERSEVILRCDTNSEGEIEEARKG
jgi:hypothetical protein